MDAIDILAALALGVAGNWITHILARAGHGLFKKTPLFKKVIISFVAAGHHA